MIEDPQADDQLREVLGDAARDFYHSLLRYDGPLRQAFSAYADEMVKTPLVEGETLEQRVLTAMMLAFMAGREHKARGYVSPVPKDQPVDEIDDAAAEMIERMSDPD